MPETIKYFTFVYHLNSCGIFDTSHHMTMRPCATAYINYVFLKYHLRLNVTRNMQKTKNNYT